MKKIISSILAVIIGVEAFFLVNDFERKEKYVSVVKKAMPAAVEIRVIGTFRPQLFDMESYYVSDQLRGVLGSGAYISSNGYILTVAHLFNGFDTIKSITVTAPNGDVVFAHIKQLGIGVDLAIIKVDYYKTTPFLTIADQDSLSVGQEVLAIGSPAGLSFSVSRGIISALNREFKFTPDTLQSDCATNPGNSGGPMINLKGQLIGVVSFFIPLLDTAPLFTGLGFSVSAWQCKGFVRKAALANPDLKYTMIADKILRSIYVR